ncbi:MAG TPA: hypothetical protein VIH60_04665 [Steroidobacteraceae bacterium]|jgi:hypothetical protein
MTSWPPLAPDGAHPGERLSNWLALLALLACGILWVPADSGVPVAPAGSLAARSAASSQNVIPGSAIVTVTRVAGEAELHEMTAHGPR